MGQGAGELRYTPDGEPEYAALAALQQSLQSLDRLSETASRELGCTASMFQLLLAVKTARRAGETDIGMLATSLRVRHPSAAEMVRKAETRGLVTTAADPADGRRVLVRLTDHGLATVESLALIHAAEVRRLRGGLLHALRALA
jgi:DNA-binding MarR family transcriptional regulator